MHEEEDDTLRLGLKVRLLRQQRTGQLPTRRRGLSLLRQHAQQAQLAETASGRA